LVGAVREIKGAVLIADIRKLKGYLVFGAKEALVGI
jgi:hypothetical protein